MTSLAEDEPTLGDQLVDRLMAAFPGGFWSYETIDLYARCLEPVEGRTARWAVDRAVLTLDQPPTVRWLLDTAYAEARRLGLSAEPVDADEPVNADPSVSQRVRVVYAQACATIDARVSQSTRGADGHWHGGPDPCPVCGGQVPAWLVKR